MPRKDDESYWNNSTCSRAVDADSRVHSARNGDSYLEDSEWNDEEHDGCEDENEDDCYEDEGCSCSEGQSTAEHSFATIFIITAIRVLWSALELYGNADYCGERGYL